MSERLEGTLSTYSYNIKEDIFLTNGLYSLACCIVLRILKTLCGMFQHFILVVALCIREMREVSIQGVFGY